MTSLPFFLVVLGLALGEHPLPNRISESPEIGLWNRWKELHQKQYETAVEEVKRFEIWLENLKFVKHHNIAHDLGLKTYKTSINELADLTVDEFVASRLGVKTSRPVSPLNRGKSSFDHLPLGDVPAKIDWRQYGMVTGVKNQGQCGSCWSFSATGAVEGQMKNVTGYLVSLSEQQLVDCDDYCFGCNGGWVQYGYQYILEHGSVSERDYPYEAVQRACRTGNKKVYGYVSRYVDLSPGDEEMLKQAVGHVGPVSIAIDASHQSFQLYHSGVYYESYCGNTPSSLDHAVLAVGYGTDQWGIDYWIVKNSWGSKWGQKGYVLMARGFGNNCGVATDATYPLVF